MTMWRRRAYPAILALAGLTDPRVTYWEPLKWVARLRERMTGGGPVLLRTNMEAGHAGASGRFERLEEVALGMGLRAGLRGAGLIWSFGYLRGACGAYLRGRRPFQVDGRRICGPLAIAARGLGGGGGASPTLWAWPGTAFCGF